MTTMRAAICTSYGDAQSISVGEVERPKRQPGELLIEVHASSINPVDWKILRGDLRILYGLKPPRIIGGDFAGIVLECDRDSPFKPGQKVWGLTDIRQFKSTPGAHCEVTRCASHLVDAMPTTLSFTEAATLHLVGLTAYQSLVHHARLQSGQKVLINGCSGGVGFIAVQLAKALGAQVTGVCSQRNHDMAYRMGCDHVIDYQTNDPLAAVDTYDVWFDVVGKYNLRHTRHQLTRTGTYLNIVKLFSTSLSSLLNPLRRQASHAVFVSPNADDLARLRALIDASAIRPLIERTYPLTSIADALTHSRTHRVVGKLAVSVARSSTGD